MYGRNGEYGTVNVSGTQFAAFEGLEDLSAWSVSVDISSALLLMSVIVFDDDAHCTVESNGNVSTCLVGESLSEDEADTLLYSGISLVSPFVCRWL